MHKYTAIIILFLIIISGTFLRLYNLNTQSYWMDEGYTINAVLSILEKGNTILDSGEKYFCSIYCYPTAWFAKIFGADPFSYRLLAAIFGILTIIASYFISKKFFGKNAALLSTFFVSFSYWQIAWSRQARWYTLLTLFFWLAIYFYYNFLQSKNQKEKIHYFLLSIALAVMAILTHRIAYLLIPIFLILLFFKKYHGEQNSNSKKKELLIIFSIFIILFFVLELFFNFNLSKTFFADLKLYYVLPYYLSFFLTNYWLFIFLSLYAYLNCPKDKKLTYGLFLLPFIVYLIAFSFFTNILHYRYLFAPALGFLLLGGVATTEIFKKFQQKNKLVAWGFLFFVIIVFFLFGQGVWRPLSFYTLESETTFKRLNERPYHGYTPQPNFNAAYQFVADNLTSEEIVISSHPHFNKIFLQQPGYWIKYNYLGFENNAYKTSTDREFYVNAKVINNLEELKEIILDKHGYIVFDQMSITGRIDAKIVYYIQNFMEEIFFDEINSYSKIWVYKF